ncbi:MAG: glycoside hydrolase family 9 protein [Cyanobacteria bacterium P01_A01_bin.114]
MFSEPPLSASSFVDSAAPLSLYAEGTLADLSKPSTPAPAASGVGNTLESLLPESHPRLPESPVESQISNTPLPEALPPPDLIGAPDVEADALLAPGIYAELETDTGLSSTDRITSDSTISGQVVTDNPLASFQVGFANQPQDQWIDLTFLVRPDGAFRLNQGWLEAANGGPLSDGLLSLGAIATDTLNETLSTSFDFTLAAQAPEIAQVYAVSPDVLALQIDVGSVIYGRHVPFTAQPDDGFVENRDRLWVERNGQFLGSVVGPDQNQLLTLDRLVGEPLDLTLADSPASYQISSKNDPDYAAAAAPQAVFRKSKPTDMARVDRFDYDWALTHTLYLNLPKPLEIGQTYTIQLPELGAVEFLYTPLVSRSEAVHVSQVGFRPDDPLKVGYLSTWMGNGGGLDYADDLRFWLIDELTGQKVYRGNASVSHTPGEAEDPRGRDYTQTEVQALDFSDFSQPGEYRLCVEGVGCSTVFNIAAETWQSAFELSARGFYHQRSGIALGAPYTNYERPRAFHPDDGVQIYQSTATLMDSSMGLNPDKSSFEALAEGKTDGLVNVSGGYFDAGDWDRRIQHLTAARRLLELVELFPTHFATVDLNIPESANNLPDVLDEALWGLDFFRRLQQPNGGISGGIESSRHPIFGETSWLESNEVFAYAPDPWSSYIYAGVAARAANALKILNPEQAATYQDSARRAMVYAEREVQAAETRSETLPQAVEHERNLAALELFRLTGDATWHEVFLATTAFQQPPGNLAAVSRYPQLDAAFLYARLDELLVDADVQQNAIAALLQSADGFGALSENTAFGWSKSGLYNPIGAGNSWGAPHSIDMIRAHFLTGDRQYLAQGLRSTQFSVGANPDNMTFTTGLGIRNPQNPLVIDQRLTGQLPPEGITVYGPLDLTEFPDYWTVGLFADETFPTPALWPTVESYYDVYFFPAATEFTIDYMSQSTYTWGYLAARETLTSPENLKP